MQIALDKLDSNLKGYIEAGGRQPTYEERRAALLTILPPKFREDVFFRIPAVMNLMVNASADEQDIAYRDLRAQLQRQVELITQWSRIGGGFPGGAQPGANVLL